MVKGVIFDMDGTMFDTERIALVCWKKSGKMAGYDIDDEFISRFRGVLPSECKVMAAKRFGPEFDYDAMRAVRTQLMWEIVERDGVPVKKGLMELMKFLKEQKIPMAVATSNSRDRAERLLKMAGVYDDLTAVVYGDMVTKSKPDPEIFHLAAKKIGCSPKDCLVIEDSTAGVAGAIAAGGYSIYVPDLTEVPEEVKRGLSAEQESLLDVIDWIRKVNAEES